MIVTSHVQYFSSQLCSVICSKSFFDEYVSRCRGLRTLLKAWHLEELKPANLEKIPCSFPSLAFRGTLQPMKNTRFVPKKHLLDPSPNQLLHAFSQQNQTRQRCRLPPSSSAGSLTVPKRKIEQKIKLPAPSDSKGCLLVVFEY